MKAEFYRKKLSNGLTVLFEKRKLPVVTTSVTAKVGAEYEPEKIKGISHFIEHLVFKGTKNRKQKEISGEIEKRGGVLNAFTGEEVTCFWNKLPSKHLGLGVEIASDMALNPLFDAKELERERKVILEEIKMYHDHPQYYVIKKIKSLLYEKPYGTNISGTSESVSGIKREEILNHYKSAYSSDNMILTVIGNADFQEVCSLGEEIFPKTKNKVKEIIPIKKSQELIEKRRGLDQANLVLGYHIPSLKDKGRYDAQILNVILAGGMSSRLFQEIREKRGLAYAVKGLIQQDRNYGNELIYVGTTKPAVKKVKELILKEIKKIQKLEKRDFQEAKEQLIGLKEVESENSEETMAELIYEENAGNAEEYYKFQEKIAGLKLENLKKAAKLKSYSFIALIPY
jgi:predicted Zn-dependent peptidase